MTIISGNSYGCRFLRRSTQLSMMEVLTLAVRVTSSSIQISPAQRYTLCTGVSVTQAAKRSVTKVEAIDWASFGGRLLIISEIEVDMS